MQNTTLYLIIGAAVGLFIGYNKLKSSREGYKNEPDRPFPSLWRQILRENVVFYNRLSSLDKTEFERKVHVFLLKVPIRGVKTEVSHEDKVLIAAGAIIPIFRFKKWHYANLNEVQLFPDKFPIPETSDYAHGLVGWGAMEGIMMLSRKAVLSGFQDNSDNKNVVIHECVHLLDKQDGKIDGVMEKFMREADIEPWLYLTHTKKSEIDSGNSTIREYGGSNNAEFLSVVSEYYFMNPEQLQQDHPGLYNALDSFYNADMQSPPIKDRFKKRRRRL